MWCEFFDQEPMIGKLLVVWRFESGTYHVGTFVDGAWRYQGKKFIACPEDQWIYIQAVKP